MADPLEVSVSIFLNTYTGITKERQNYLGQNNESDKFKL